MSEFYVNWRKVKFEGCIQSFMLPWKLRKRQFLDVNQNLSSVYFSFAKFQLVSCNLSLAMIWQMTYTHKLPKLCSTTLNGTRLQIPPFPQRWNYSLLSTTALVSCLITSAALMFFLFILSFKVSSAFQNQMPVTS